MRGLDRRRGCPAGEGKEEDCELEEACRTTGR